MHPWHDVPWGDDRDGTLHVVIEISEGSKVKYELDKATGMLRADRVLYSAVHYPANYGFIPRTWCEDGDPLDVLLLCQQPLAPMSIARGRAIGVIPMSDDKGKDDKIIAVHADDPQFSHYGDISELPPHVLDELKRFFLDYKVLELKPVQVGALQGRAEADAVVRSAVASYAENAARLRGGR